MASFASSATTGGARKNAWTKSRRNLDTANVCEESEEMILCMNESNYAVIKGKLYQVN